jgi:thioredoxin-related protein
MKNIFISLLLIIGLSISMNSQSMLNWEDNYEKAVKKAKKEKKPVLLFFTGSDWCGPCKMLKADFFKTKRFKKIADNNFVLYEADFPKKSRAMSEEKRKKNYWLGGMYDVNSYPTIVIIDANGKEIARKKSYNLMRDPSYHFRFLKDVLGKQNI